jgi:anti-anti-sigma factor
MNNNILIETRHSFTVLRPEGPLVVSGLFTFRKTIEELIQEGKTFLAIDLGKVKNIDSSALGLLRNVHANLGRSSGMLCLYNVNANIRELLTVSSMENYFHIFADEKEFDDNFSF